MDIAYDERREPFSLRELAEDASIGDELEKRWRRRIQTEDLIALGRFARSESEATIGKDVLLRATIEQHDGCRWLQL